MGISAVSGTSGSGSYYFGAIASGNRITSAAVDASGSAISEKLKSQEGAINANMENIASGVSALNVADGSLSSITDYLQRIKELSVKASNGLYTPSEKQAIQDEIDQNKQGIADTINSSEYNTKKLLDGTFEGVEIVDNPDGSGKDVSIGQATLKALGLEDYDVTGDFDMSRVDDALALVSSKRSAVGADTNALQAAYEQSAGTLEQVSSADSRLADLDIPKAVSDLKKQQLLDDIAIQMQKKREEEAENNIVTKTLGG